MNNFVGQEGNKGKRDNAQSHSPSGLGAGSSNKDNQILPMKNVKKNLKVVGSIGKSPYINNVFKDSTALTNTT